MLVKSETVATVEEVRHAIFATAVVVVARIVVVVVIIW
jgi:hypothetical protein